MTRRNPFKGWTRRTYPKFGVAVLGSWEGIFLWRMDRFGRWNVHAYIAETIGLDGVE